MNKPATPLPWVAHGLGIYAGPQRVADVEKGKDRLFVAHACNAYPRLVEALRDASAQPLNWHPDHASALLRDLGEAE